MPYNLVFNLLLINLQKTTKANISKLTHVRERKNKQAEALCVIDRFAVMKAVLSCFHHQFVPLSHAYTRGFWPGQFYIPGNLLSFVIFTLFSISYQIHLVLQSIRNWQ